MYTGMWARGMRNWPCLVLVPRLSQRVFSLAMVILVSTTLATSALTWDRAGSVPPVGPALLVGTYMAYAMARRPFLNMLLASPVIFLPLLVSVAANFAPFEDYPLLQALSRPTIQISAIAIAVVFAATLRRRLQTPAVQNEVNLSQTSFWAVLMTRIVFLTAFTQGLRPTYAMSAWTMTKISVLTAAVVLTIDLSNGFSAIGLHGVMFTTVVIMIWPAVMINNGIDFRVAWLGGRGRTRHSLARHLVARIVVAGALPMLAFLLAAEAIRSMVGRGSASFEPLLVAQIAAFGLLALCFTFRDQFPNERAEFLTAVLLLTSLVIWLRSYQPFLEPLQFGPGAYVVIVLALAVSAVAAVFAAGWGLARADHLQ